MRTAEVQFRKINYDVTGRGHFQKYFLEKQIITDKVPIYQVLTACVLQKSNFRKSTMTSLGVVI